MICNNCRVLMRQVMRFEAGKAWKLKRCPKCFYETRPAPLYFDDDKATQQSSRKHQERPKQKSIKYSRRKRAKKR